MRIRKAFCLFITVVLAFFLGAGLVQTRAIAEGEERIQTARPSSTG